MQRNLICAVKKMLPYQPIVCRIGVAIMPTVRSVPRASEATALWCSANVLLLITGICLSRNISSLVRKFESGFSMQTSRLISKSGKMVQRIAIKLATNGDTQTSPGLFLWLNATRAMQVLLWHTELRLT